MNTTSSDRRPLEDAFARVLAHPAVILLKMLARSSGIDLYLVGGAVRDLFRTGRLPQDLDFAVIGGTAESLARQAAEQLEGHYVLLDETFGIHRVVVRRDNPPDNLENSPDLTPDLTLDLADALDGDILQDLARRDLTVNALALNLETGALLDPHDGLSDLRYGVLRGITEANFLEDPLRLLRAFRLAAQLSGFLGVSGPSGVGFSIAPETLAWIQAHREQVNRSAPERIHVELLKLLDAPRCFPSLKQMGETGLLEVILPELTATRAIPPNAYHHLWLYDHTLELVHQAEQQVETFPEAVKTHLSQAVTPFVTRTGVVKLGCLLHDIGKPGTYDIREDGKHTFYGHDRLSEEMTADICKRLRLGNAVGDRLKKLVRWHLYPCQFGPDSPRRSILRFLRRMGDETPDVILLAIADRLSTLGPQITPEVLEESVADHRWLLDQYSVEAETLRLPRLLDGARVMALLKLPPGPRVGEVMASLQEAHQLGEVQTPEAAEAWILENFG